MKRGRRQIVPAGVPPVFPDPCRPSKVRVPPGPRWADVTVRLLRLPLARRSSTCQPATMRRALASPDRRAGRKKGKDVRCTVRHLPAPKPPLHFLRSRRQSHRQPLPLSADIIVIDSLPPVWSHYRKADCSEDHMPDRQSLLSRRSDTAAHRTRFRAAAQKQCGRWRLP